MENGIRTHSQNEGLIAERRLQITQAAAKLFARKGYLSTGIREIARECNMTMGTLYYYIGSKEDILYLTITQSRDSLTEVINDIIGSSSGITAVESLKNLIQMVLQWMDRNQDEVVFIYHETHNMDQRSRDVVFQRDTEIVDCIKALLEKGVEAGEFDLEDTDFMAHNILVLMHAWAFRRWFFGKHHTLEDHIGMLTGLICRTVGSQKTVGHPAKRGKKK
jgi:AcrR family transcriptional regulator